MRRFNDYLMRLPLGLYGTISGLTTAVAILALQIALTDKSLGASVGIATAVGISDGIGSAIGRARARERQRLSAKRLTKPS